MPSYGPDKMHRRLYYELALQTADFHILTDKHTRETGSDLPRFTADGIRTISAREGVHKKRATLELLGKICDHLPIVVEQLKLPDVTEQIKGQANPIELEINLEARFNRQVAGALAIIATGAERFTRTHLPDTAWACDREIWAGPNNNQEQTWHRFIASAVPLEVSRDFKEWQQHNLPSE